VTFLVFLLLAACIALSVACIRIHTDRQLWMSATRDAIRRVNSTQREVDRMYSEMRQAQEDFAELYLERNELIKELNLRSCPGEEERWAIN
jgi:hypothetical protein